MQGNLASDWTGDTAWGDDASRDWMRSNVALLDPREEHEWGA